jgi:hypothetical protein
MSIDFGKCIIRLVTFLNDPLAYLYLQRTILFQQILTLSNAKSGEEGRGKRKKVAGPFLFFSISGVLTLIFPSNAPGIVQNSESYIMRVESVECSA